MQINTSVSALRNLFNLINQDNGTTLTEAEITIGAPTEFTDDTGANDRNTQVTLTAVDGGGYTDSVDIRYYRLGLDTLRGARVLERQLTDTSTVGTVVTAMATTVGLIEDQLELIDADGNVLTELPTIAAGETAGVYLSAKADSYCYFGSTGVTLIPAETDTNVNDEVTTTDMSGFDYPDDGSTETPAA